MQSKQERKRRAEMTWYLDASYLPIYSAQVADDKNTSSQICTKNEDNSRDK